MSIKSPCVLSLGIYLGCVFQQLIYFKKNTNFIKNPIQLRNKR
ncbi:hypothetical protein QWZ13_00805 [Reinekea marina]|nr:hypothetical protein [Reinekea marina]MDN3647443.1 hypothetical protein [Reinekea marina]